MAEYHDRRIDCAGQGIRIGWYYPWGAKFVPYDQVRGVHRVLISSLRGQFRIWGTANPKYWANLDPSRPSKQVGFVLDLGRTVRPFVTPDDPETFEAVVRQATHLPPSPQPAPGPVI